MKSGLSNHTMKFFTLLCLFCLHIRPLVADSFGDVFTITGRRDHVIPSRDGQEVQLMLDKTSGSYFASKDLYLFGSISVRLKLVPGDSAGVVTALYMASAEAAIRDELDFEFLGNITGEPYILQTNIYTRGSGSREQRFYLWFDPSSDFHTYSILWNQHQIVFSVDNVPIRVFINDQSKAAYADSQPMAIRCSLWDAEDWATENGKMKTNWSNAPFVASFRNFNVEACVWVQGPRRPTCALPTSSWWWNQPPFITLAPTQLQTLKWAKNNYMIYDYCRDSRRFPTPPSECSLNP